MLVIDSVADPRDRARLFHRHFAWLTALRFQLREPRVWEAMSRSDNVEYGRRYQVAEWTSKLEVEIQPLLSESEAAQVLAKKNRALHLLDQQSRDLHRLILPGVEGELRRMEFQRLLAAMVDAQGRCERIKNFPYPRQYATLNHFFVWLFIVLTPFALLQEFQKLGGGFVWLTIPASVVVAWVFHTMDKIGEGTENPFEGGPNDVPITAMSRGIEIDLREMLGETQLPAAIQPQNHILL